MVFLPAAGFQKGQRTGIRERSKLLKLNVMSMEKNGASCPSFASLMRFADLARPTTAWKGKMLQAQIAPRFPWMTGKA